MKLSHWVLATLVAAGTFSTVPTLAQPGTVARNTKMAIKADQPVSLSLFERSDERDTKVDQAIKHVVYLKLNTEALAALNKQQYKTLSFDLPLATGMETILLAKYDLFTTDFKAQVKDQSGQYHTVAKPEGTFYRGFREGSDRSIAALSFYSSELGGVISIPGMSGNYNLVLNKENPGAQNENYILFNESDIVDGAQYISLCKNDLAQEQHPLAQRQGKTGAFTGDKGANCQVVTMALYGDYKLYQKNQNSVTATQNYLTTVFNGVAALYENDQMRVALQALNVNTAPDGYPNTAPGVLTKFGAEIATNVTANLMQMVTGYTVGNNHPPLGGLAWLKAICATPIPYNYNGTPTYVGPFSMINTAGSANLPLVPVYSWDINCSAHEFGHNLGSPHTHNCAWNGNGTAIDGCAGAYDIDYADLACPQAGIPTNQGTIMSYCHLLSNIGVNFANGFGQQPGDTLRAWVAAASEYGCLSSDYYATKVVDQASLTVVANGFCFDGESLYCYDTKNDFDRLNDELVLIINNNNISSLDLSNLQISMTTTPTYRTGAAIDASSYIYTDDVYENWYQSNRVWSIALNQALPGTSQFVFPFLDQDKTDLTGSLPAMNNLQDSMRLVIYKTEAAAQAPDQAVATDVALYNMGTASNGWAYDVTPHYQKATLNYSGPIYGATFATGKKKPVLSVRNVINSRLLKLYPNPASDQLQITLEASAGNILGLELMDYLGRTLFTQKAKGYEQSINVKSLAAGVYMIRCTTDKGVYINKFVKE